MVMEEGRRLRKSRLHCELKLAVNQPENQAPLGFLSNQPSDYLTSRHLSENGYDTPSNSQRGRSRQTLVLFNPFRSTSPSLSANFFLISTFLLVPHSSSRLEKPPSRPSNQCSVNTGYNTIIMPTTLFAS